MTRRPRSRRSARLASRADLTAALGHDFADPALLDLALTHSSAEAPQSNERLEFLGDRVLNLVIAEALYDRFPDAAEGGLGIRHARLVSRHALADVAAHIDLAAHLQRASGEAGAPSSSMLADACEAVIAAIYRDAGLEVARAFILRAWAEPLAAATDETRDPKMALQEWSLGRRLGLPVYTELARSGPAHAPLFRVEARVGEDTAEGEGSSRQRAEKAAAEALFAQLND